MVRILPEWVVPGGTVSESPEVVVVTVVPDPVSASEAVAVVPSTTTIGRFAPLLPTGKLTLAPNGKVRVLPVYVLPTGAMTITFASLVTMTGAT
jgi:hypothetical protein